MKIGGVLQELEASNLECAMAQHLLVAADRYALSRLRRICERRLCETVEVIMHPYMKSAHNPLAYLHLTGPFRLQMQTGVAETARK
jgi:hypothetical protein